MQPPQPPLPPPPPPTPTAACSSAATRRYGGGSWATFLNLWLLLGVVLQFLTAHLVDAAFRAQSRKPAGPDYYETNCKEASR